MPVTGSAFAAENPLQQQIEKIIASPHLNGSIALCRLLRFLATEAVINPGVAVKEYRIATELFHRPSEFDPKLDSTVRVQTARLRSKLAEYYSGDGAADDVVVEMPKGSYLVTYHHKLAPAGPLAHPESPSLPPPEPRPVPEPERLSVRWRWGIGVALASLVVAFAVAVILYSRAEQEISAMLRAENVQPGDLATLRHFWTPMLHGAEAPIVIFSNAEFTGRPETGMRYLTATDSREGLLDHYTGVGEVVAVHELDHVFSALRLPLRVKRGRLLSLDDAKTHDLIFVGSSAENLALLDFPVSKDFVIRRAQDGPRRGDIAVVNVSPKAGEEAQYMADRELPITDDYAVIAVQKNDNPSAPARILLAGTTTMGTEAAVEFACDPARIRELLSRVLGSSDADVRPFEAVLQVKVSKGVPVHSQILAVRSH
jgi:hypothetical protein